MSDAAVPWPVRARRWLLHELRLVLPPTIYFLCAFNLIVFTTNLMTRPYWFTLERLTVATLLALVVGKAILVADKLPLVDRFRHRPMIQTILWRAAFYSLFVGLVRTAEMFVHFEFDGRGFDIAMKEAIDSFTWKRFIAVQLWLMVCFLVYVAVSELDRRLGPGRLVHLLLRDRRDAARPHRRCAD